MEIKKRLALQHTSGLFLSWSPDNYPHTPNESQARRFYKAEDIASFLSESHYKPDNPDEYEIVTLKITYELEDTDNVPQVGNDGEPS